MQVFEHFQNLVLNLRSLAITRAIAQMPYVHLRLPAFTCDNLSQPSVTYRNPRVTKPLLRFILADVPFQNVLE